MKFERLRFPTVGFQSAVYQSEFAVCDSLMITCLSPVIHQFIHLFRFSCKLSELSALNISGGISKQVAFGILSPKALET